MAWPLRPGGPGAGLSQPECSRAVGLSNIRTVSFKARAVGGGCCRRGTNLNRATTGNNLKQAVRG
eukprot:3698432-Rhodomonas_salina.5